MTIDIIPVGQMQANCYVLAGCLTKNAILIDSGDDYGRIASFLRKKGLKPQIIIHTHGHIDHIQADSEFGLPVYVHELDVELLKDPNRNLSGFFGAPFSLKSGIREVKDLSDISLDDLTLQVIHTPGHTPGGICLLSQNVVFTGDTLFAGSVGRTDFPGASEKQLIKSIKERLLVLPDETIIYPGHGPASTIGQERRNNPFLCES